MKKLLSIFLCLILLLSLISCTGDEEPAKKTVVLPFESLKLSFCSGAGAWSTELILNADGSFTGFYMDNSVADSDSEDYPDGTNYVCDFIGSFENIRKINEYTYALSLGEVSTSKEYGEEWIEDRVRYIASPPYGIYDGREFFLYAPEAPVGELDKTFLSWFPIGLEFDGEKLGKYGLFNVETGDGFFSFE